MKVLSIIRKFFFPTKEEKEKALKEWVEARIEAYKNSPAYKGMQQQREEDLKRIEEMLKTPEGLEELLIGQDDD